MVAETLSNLGLQLLTLHTVGHDVTAMNESIRVYTDDAVPMLETESVAVLQAFEGAMSAVNRYAPPRADVQRAPPQQPPPNA